MSKTPKKLIDQYVDKHYDEDTQEIAKKNLALSMKLSGLLSMLDAYFAEYHQNQKEIIKIANGIVSAEERTPEQRKLIQRRTKNQLNKIDNQGQAFDKFVKRFGKEFTGLFGNTNLEDKLLDVFDKFWDDAVTIDEDTVTIEAPTYEGVNKG